MKKTVKLQKHDSDIHVMLPNGDIIDIQWRIESPSIDIIFPKPVAVNNWEGEDMKPAPSVNRQSHVRLADQLCIPLDPDIFS